MNSTNITVRLSRSEIDYLCNAGFLELHQIDILRQAEIIDNSDATLSLARNIAEVFREKFTEQLAKVGFDENYKTTSEGIMLEELIDRFYQG